MKSGFKLNWAGVREVMRSAGMCEMIKGKADGVKGSAASMGGRYESEVRTGRNRAVGYVRAADAETYFRNLRTNALLKALGGQR
jgi:hypothetical protein